VRFSAPIAPCLYRLTLFGIGTFAIAEASSSALTGVLNAIDPEPGVFATAEPIPPMPLYVLAGSGAAAVVVGRCLRFSDEFGRLGILRVVTPAGRQCQQQLRPAGCRRRLTGRGV